MIIWTCVCFVALFGVGQAQQRETPSSITHQDIRDAILTLATAMRDIGSKLERHEARESLLATSQNKMLNTLDTRSKGAEKNLEGLLKIMTMFDDKIKKLETNMLQRDDSQRVQLQKVIDAVSRIPTTGSTAPTSTPEDNRIINRVIKKIDGFERSVLTRLPMIGNEVKIVGEKLDARSARIEQLQVEAKELASRKQTSETDTLKTAVSSILAGESRLIKAIGEFDGISTRLDSGVVSLSGQIARFNNDTSAILSSINSVHTSLDNMTAAASVPAYAPFDLQELKEIDKNIKSTAASVDKVGEMVMSTSKMIKDIEKTTATELKDVKKMSEKTATDVGTRLDRYMSEIVKKINDSQTTIQYQVSEAGDMAESLSERVEQGYKNISAEIRGLTNVEQVLLDTADSVMDTKRRLEYAVQQILLELGETVRKQTGSLHTELTKSVDNVTLTVLGQQGTAWKNLTTKLESELGQVWRQIGVLHQTAIQSQSILDKMETQSVSHINGTLKTLENMDGKVLIVTNRMGEVEENLNYLLGRLSLVVQEFNQIRGGLGDTLDSLRANMAVIHEKIPETKKSGTSPKSGDDLERRENMIQES